MENYKRVKSYIQYYFIWVFIFLLSVLFAFLYYIQTRNRNPLVIFGIIFLVYVVVGSYNVFLERINITEKEISYKSFPFTRKFKYGDIKLIRIPPNYQISPFENTKDLVITRGTFRVYRISLISTFEYSEKLIEEIKQKCNLHSIELKI